MNRNRIYGIVFGACLAGMLWMGYQLWPTTSGGSTSSDVCLIKKATGIPCPSCGTTRSIKMLVEGNLTEALHLNPFGVIVFLIMIISPVWIMLDYINKSNSFLNWYGRMEIIFRSKWVALPAAGLVLANWIWNMVKGL